MFTHENDKPRPTVESIMRQQKIRKIIFRAIMIFILIIICIFIGWFIGTIGQKTPQTLLHPENNRTLYHVVA